MGMVPFTLARIILSDAHPSQRIVLKEADGERHFAIDIGEYEAVAIYRRATRRQHQRPLTHDLMDRMLAGMGGTLRAVEITELKDRTFFADLVIDTADGEVRVDARPSDAMALLVGNNAELLVDEERVLGALAGE